MLIFTAPGQGAQTPGFLSPWLEIPGLAEQFGAWSELAGRDLIRLGTTGSAEEITDTAVAQPLLVASAIAVAGLLGEPDAAAGHSVGELAAGAIAGVLTAADAIRLTRVRGESMAAACDAEATGMTAVLGGVEAAVLAAIAEAGLTPANINAAGQIVAGGTLEQLAEFAANPPAGARLRPLRVAGAFHTKHMAHGGRRAGGGGGRHRRQRPGDHAAVQPRRRGRHLRPGLGGADRAPGRQPGPLGSVHGHHVRHQRDRDDRARPGRHADRHGQARAARRRAARDQDPGPARRGPGADRRARDGDQRLRGELGRVGPRLDDRGVTGRRNRPFDLG